MSATAVSLTMPSDVNVRLGFSGRRPCLLTLVPVIVERACHQTLMTLVPLKTWKCSFRAENLRLREAAGMIAALSRATCALQEVIQQYRFCAASSSKLSRGLEPDVLLPRRSHCLFLAAFVCRCVGLFQGYVLEQPCP